MNTRGSKGTLLPLCSQKGGFLNFPVERFSLGTNDYVFLSRLTQKFHEDNPNGVRHKKGD